MPEPTDPRVLRTRERVLTAAYDLLTELGFGQVTVDDVSARSGVSRSTLYRHWPSLSELLRDAFSARAMDAPEGGRALADALEAYALTFAQGLEHAWGRAAASLAVAALDDPAQRQVQQEFVRRYSADLDQLVQAAVRRGEVPASATHAETTDRLVAVLFYRYLFTDGPLDVGLVRAEVGHAVACLRAGSPRS